METVRTSELRIGNFIGWYEPKHEILLVKVNGIVGKMIYAQVNGTFQQCHENYKSWRPIPLTEEWLLKFNEVRKFGGTIYLPLMNLKAEIHFEIYGNHIISTVKSDFAELILNPIKHVHQLQNLYFALTNEELEWRQ